MKRTKEWWARLTKQERSELVYLTLLRKANDGLFVITAAEVKAADKENALAGL